MSGSGKLVREERLINPFDSLEIEYINGKVTILIGEGPTSCLEILLDDNLHPFLQVEDKEAKLKLPFSNRQRFPVWTVEYSVVVTIKTSSLKKVVYNANGNFTVNGLSSKIFSLN